MHLFSNQKEITNSKFAGTTRPDTLLFQPARMYRSSVQANLWRVPQLVMKSEVWTKDRSFKNIKASPERPDKKMK